MEYIKGSRSAIDLAHAHLFRRAPDEMCTDREKLHGRRGEEDEKRRIGAAPPGMR